MVNRKRVVDTILIVITIAVVTAAMFPFVEVFTWGCHLFGIDNG